MATENNHAVGRVVEMTGLWHFLSGFDFSSAHLFDVVSVPAELVENKSCQ